MTPPNQEYQRFQMPKAIQRLLDKNPDAIIPITKKAQENRLRRIAEAPARKLAAKEAQKAQRAAVRAAHVEAERYKRRPYTPEEQVVRIRLNKIKNTYGLNGKALLRMIDIQDWKCAICREAFEGLDFHVDHCHLPPYKVRGVLCRRCNLRIGGWDDPGWAKAAAAYLRIIPRKEAVLGLNLDEEERP